MGHEAKTGFDALVTEGPCVPAPSPGRGTAWGPLPLRQAGPAEHGWPRWSWRGDSSGAQVSTKSRPQCAGSLLWEGYSPSGAWVSGFLRRSDGSGLTGLLARPGDSAGQWPGLRSLRASLRQGGAWRPPPARDPTAPASPQLRLLPQRLPSPRPTSLTKPGASLRAASLSGTLMPGSCTGTGDPCPCPSPPQGTDHLLKMEPQEMLAARRRLWAPRPPQQTAPPSLT